MGLHVILGSGPIGTAAAEHLVALGHSVRMVTRHGGGPTAVGSPAAGSPAAGSAAAGSATGGPVALERVAADATDADRLTTLVTGADALYNCASPPYHRWPQEWPPLAAAILTAAQRSGAILVTMSNLYGYGPVEGLLTEALPLAATSPKLKVRADMWRAALAAHQAGRLRATEARASDFIGPRAQSMFTTIVMPGVRAGKRTLVPANLDVPHSHTFTGDVGRTLAVLGTDPRALGRAWHVPTAPALSVRELAARFAALVGAPAPRLTVMSNPVLRLGGLFNAEAREFVKVRYQFEHPWIIDSTAAQETFGLVPTSTDAALATMV